MTTITSASSDAHLQQILALQRRYRARALSSEQQQAEGFVFAEHTLALLKSMAAELPQAIALSEDQVVAYCLAMPLSMQTAVPSLVPMFEQFARCSFRGKRLSDYRFMVGGQVCVDRAFRGHGSLTRLYHHIRQSVPSGYELCVTEIATRNPISIRAHEKMGFETIATYSDDHEQWVVVAWDLLGPSLAIQQFST